jgi:hypothetical protein
MALADAFNKIPNNKKIAPFLNDADVAAQADPTTGVPPVHGVRIRRASRPCIHRELTISPTRSPSSRRRAMS